RQLIDEDKLGEIYHWRGAYQQGWLVDPDVPVDWKLKKATAGAGPHWDLGSHAVDLAQYLNGDITSVQCKLKTFRDQRPDASDPSKMAQVEVDDAALMMVEFANGSLGSIETTRYATGRKNRHTFEISGSKGAMFWDMEDMNRIQFFDNTSDAKTAGWTDIMATDPSHPYMKYWPPGHIIGYEHAFINGVADFLDAIAANETIEPNFEDGVKIIRVLEAAIESNEGGGIVQL
ncbi:MAG: Gfo/Idh/MocA family oxidoreductase, partial [Verrucomicrobiota bacterium]